MSIGAGGAGAVKGSGKKVTYVRDRIRQSRLKKKYNQSELALKSHTTRTVIAKIEQGKIRPTYKMLEDIGRALDWTEKALDKACKELFDEWEMSMNLVRGYVTFTNLDLK